MAGRLNTAAREVAPVQVSQKWNITSNPFPLLDPVHLALSRLRRRRFDESLQVSTELLANTPLDQQVCNIVNELTSYSHVSDDHGLIYRHKYSMLTFFMMLQVWWIKCRALTNKNWIDDTEARKARHYPEHFYRVQRTSCLQSV